MYSLRRTGTLILLIGGLSFYAFGADVTLVAVGAFGEPLTQCHVDKFRPTGEKPDFKDRFHALTAKDLPDGEYEAVLSCREAYIESHVMVVGFPQFQVVSQYIRTVRSDPPPALRIRMTNGVARGETWWLTAQAVYTQRTDTAQFQGDSGEAAITDPDPGSYVVGVLSSSGYSCFREIDMVEYTRLWTFDPDTCTFHLDAFAHVVTDEDKREKKTTGWYREVRRQREELLRVLDKIAASPDSN